MVESDSIQRFLFATQNVRGAIARLDEAYKEIMLQHHYPQEIQRLLGEVLLSSVLMNSSIKYAGQLTVQLQNDGPINLLVAKCTYDNQIRGLAQFAEHTNMSEALSEFGKGQLVVTIRQPKQKDPYQSIVSIHQQSVAKSLEGYFMQSEQLPTRIFLHIRKDEAVGMMLQEVAQEDSTAEAGLAKISEAISDDVLAHTDFTIANANLLQLYFEDDIHLFDPEPVEFKCDCTIERMINVIKSLGEAEALDILKEKQVIAVTCEYCNNEYGFSREEVEIMFSS